MTTPPPSADEPLPNLAAAPGEAAITGSVRVGNGDGGDRRPVGSPATPTGRRAVRPGWYLLLLVPFVALLWLPFYARRTPELLGFPFFYWYQLLWVVLGAAITGLVYALTTPGNPPSREPMPERRKGAHRRPGRP